MSASTCPRELGFSREHRDLNILRIGYVASEITKNGGIALCAPIAPYAATRGKVRKLIEPRAASSRCTSRPRSRSAKAATARGSTPRPAPAMIKEFTGISDPYEAPAHPEIRIDTAELTPDLAAHRILIKLESLGFIR